MNRDVQTRTASGLLGAWKGIGKTEHPRRTAAAIAGLFCTVAVAWILLSDKVLYSLPFETATLHRLEVAKGIFWQMATTVLLYVLVSRPLVRLTRAKEEAQARAMELQTVLDAVPVAVWIARDPECRVIEGNRIGRELLGQREPVNLSLSAPSDERPAGFSVWSGGRELAPDELPIQRAARTGEDVRGFEEEVVHADGRRVALLGNAVPLRGPDGRVTGAVGAFIDVSERLRVESALRASESRLRALFDALPDPAWEWDVRADRSTFSATWPALLGYGDAEEADKEGAWEDRLHPDDRERVLAALDAAVRGPADVYEAEYRIRCRDGSYRWVLSRGRVVERGADGRAQRMIGGITDMTERRRVEARLHERDALLQKLTVQVPGMLYQYRQNPDGTACFPYASEGARIVYEASPEELRRSAAVAWSRIHPDDLARVMESVAQSLERLDMWRAEYRVVLPGRGLRWLEGHAVPERLPDGGVLWHGHIIDITERRAADDALRASEEKYRLVLRATSDAVWEYDPATDRLIWGDNVESMFGVTLGEMGDRLEGWSNRLHPDDYGSAHNSFVEAVARGDERWTAEYRFRRGDGTYAVVLDRGYVLKDDAGRIIRVIGAMSDITERRHAERMAAGQARALEQLAAGEPLDDVLETIVRTLEEVETGCAASVLLLDEDGQTVHSGPAPSLPREFTRSIDGARIGPVAGSCGTAMHRRRRVVVTDIATDPLWADFKHLALPHGLRACWSEPVIGAGGRVLGSLAMYYREVRGPGERELRMISWAARLVGIAIERRRAEEQLRKRETDLRDLLNAVPDLMFRVDRDGRYIEFHAPNPDDLYAPPDQFLGRTVRDVMPADLAERCMEHLARAVSTGEPQTYEYTVQGRRGTRHWEVRITRCAEEQALLLVRDITVRRTAERQLRESQQRLSLLVQQSPLGVIVWNLDFTVAEWNTAAEHIFGWTAEQAVGRHARFILPPTAVPHVDRVWQALKENRGGTRSTNANITADGREIHCEWYNSPLIDADGRVFAVASIVDDITEQRMAQQRQQLMMAELDHRVKNNLAAVISLAEQSGRATSSYAEFRESFLGRVRALSRLHNALAATRWHGANLGALVRQTLEAFGQDASSQAAIDGPAVVLPPRVAQSVGMAVNELCTNAVKYGALSREGGRVQVRWRLVDHHGPEGPLSAVELAWTESGGPPVVAPTRRGFGTELIEGAIAYELGGSVDMRFEPDGLRCTLLIPLRETPAFAGPADSPPERSDVGS